MDLRCPAGQTSTRPGPNRRTPSCVQLRIQPQVRCPGPLLNVRCHSTRDDDPWCTNDNGSFRHPEMNSSSDEADDSGLVMPASGADTDWREFRARLVASTRRTPTSSLFPGEIDLDGPSFSGRGTSVGLSTPTLGSRWAHSLPRPEKGCLLLAHPMMFRDSQTYFYQAVILITEHCEAGTVGVILNKPSMYTLSELHLTHPLPEFNDSRLYVGGDVGGGEITLIHTHPELPGSQEVVKGINMGGIHAAQTAVAGGTAKTQDFRWFAKYAGWRAGQLEAECRRGVWFTAAASPAVIMGEPSSGDGSDQWHSVLRLMGGDYEQLSYNVRASERRQRQAVAQREQQLKQQDEDDEGKGRGPGPEDAN